MVIRSAASQEAFQPWRNPRHDLDTDATRGVGHRERAGFGPFVRYGCLRVNCEVTSSGTVFDRGVRGGQQRLGAGAPATLIYRQSTSVADIHAIR